MCTMPRAPGFTDSWWCFGRCNRVSWKHYQTLAWRANIRKDEEPKGKMTIWSWYTMAQFSEHIGIQQKTRTKMTLLTVQKQVHIGVDLPLHWEFGMLVLKHVITGCIATPLGRWQDKLDCHHVGKVCDLHFVARSPVAMLQTWQVKTVKTLGWGRVGPVTPGRPIFLRASSGVSPGRIVLGSGTPVRCDSNASDIKTSEKIQPPKLLSISYHILLKYVEITIGSDFRPEESTWVGQGAPLLPSRQWAARCLAPYEREVLREVKCTYFFFIFCFFRTFPLVLP